jgi:hypothetical protein
MRKTFSIGEVLGYGVHTFVDHLGLFLLSLLATMGTYLVLWFGYVLLMAMVLFVSVSPVIIDLFCWGRITPAALITLPAPFFIVITIGSLFFLFLFWGLQAGFIHLMLIIHDTNEGAVGDVFTRFYLAPRLFGAAFIFCLIVAGGLLLLVIPGIYWGLRFSLFPYFIVDEETDIMDALRKSYRITAHHEWKLLAIFLVLMLLNIIPLIGSTLFFFLLPIVCVYIYRKLTMQEPIIPPAIPV